MQTSFQATAIRAKMISSSRLPRGAFALTSVSAILSSLLLPSVAHADYPIASQRYLADPASLVYDGRLYLYASNDDDNNGGYDMASFVSISTDDLKNWTDHGEVLRVPRDASWANDSWAPSVTQRDDEIFVYFGNSGNGVGVVSGTSPIGPFTDPRGSALVNAQTPGASGVQWLFDPGAFIDDDGQGYLAFGGSGEGQARIIRLGSDMTSVDGSAVSVDAPDFFEASWIHKRGDIYYYSYSTSSATGTRIDYLMSSDPMTGYKYAGVALPQPPHNGNNNHAGIFEYQDKWYIAYHNRIVAEQHPGTDATHKRNLAMDELTYADDGTINTVMPTEDGLPQLKPLDPYVRVEAETMAAQSGIETEPSSEGGMNVTEISADDWISVRGVDFGDGAESFSASVASESDGGSIELHLDSPTGTLIGTCDVPNTGDGQSWEMTSCNITDAMGEQDLYFVFKGSGQTLFNFDHWLFTPIGGFVEMSDAGAAGGAGGGSGEPVNAGGASPEAGGATSGGSAAMMAGSGTTPGGETTSGGSSITGGATGASGGSVNSGNTNLAANVTTTGQTGSTTTPAGGNVMSNGAPASGGATGSIPSAGVAGMANVSASHSDSGGGCHITRGNRNPSDWLFGLVGLLGFAVLRRRR